RFARLAHRFDRFLETLRRVNRTELTVGTDNHPNAAWHGGTANASDKCSLLRSRGADANYVGLASNALVANIDIVAAGGEILTSINAQCDVAGAGCVSYERIRTVRRVAAAAC